MPRREPLIARRRHRVRRPYGDYMGLAYARPLEAVGALPLQLPYLRDVGRVLDAADGIVLGFGSDIDPARYGGEPHPKMTPHSPHRDAFELDARARGAGARAAGARDLPRDAAAQRRAAAARWSATPRRIRAATGTAGTACGSP